MIGVPAPGALKWALLGVASLAASGLACSARAPVSFADARGDGIYNVVVITVDTLRADRLGAYGFDGVATPAIDSLAREGILFENAQTTVPLTLPAHTSLFTGNYPLFHGVRDNGGFLVPEAAETLAEVLRASEYRTGGFVASYVLDKRWHLNQGFDVYYDDFDVGGQRLIAMGAVSRPANEVIDRAVEWLDEPGEKPFFLWVHLYDPHVPYDPPEFYKASYPNHPYLGEIAFADSQVGRLLKYLEGRELLDSTFVVFAADHGESLGEHGEAEHGFFIYEGVTHVPLIIRVPFGSYGGVRRDEPVSLVDVMPTVLEMTGTHQDSASQGTSLVPLFDPEHVAAPRYIYSESWYARLHYGWGALRAVRDDRFKLILSSEPELYDMLADPNEANDLAGQLNSVLFRMQRAADERIAQWSAGARRATRAELDEETRSKLASLGYIGSFQNVEEAGVDRPAPRSKIDTYNKALDANRAMNSDDYATAERLLLEILAEDPDTVDVQSTLGELYHRQGRPEDAVDAYRTAILLKPDYVYSHVFLIEELAGLGRLEEAEKAATDAIELAGPTARLYFLIGYVRGRRGHSEAAIEAYRQSLELNPESSLAKLGLARSHFVLGHLSEAETQARAALAQDDGLRGVHTVLAEIRYARGEPQAAVDEYLREIENSPKDVAAHFNLATLYREMGRDEDEERLLRRVLELDPEYPRGKLFMARVLLRRSTDYPGAIAMVESAIQQPLSHADLTLGYFLLADLYGRVGDLRLAQEWARRGQQLRQQMER